MNELDKLTRLAMELQSLAQIGLTYTKDIYDKERFERIREISAELLTLKTDMPFEKIKDLFCCETGYQTPVIIITFLNMFMRYVRFSCFAM